MDDPTHDELTQILARASEGDDSAVAQAASAVYEELREIAARELRGERPDQTLRTTALVNEAFIRLVGQREVEWESRRHFLGTAARAMRSILVDHARARKALKRGGDRKRAPLDDVVDAIQMEQVDLLALDEALAKLEAVAERKARVVELRYFAGLTIAETAQTLGVSTGTVENDWEFARTWLHRELGGGGA